MRKSRTQTIEAVGYPFRLSSRAAQMARDLAIVIGAQKRRAPWNRIKLSPFAPISPHFVIT